MTWVAGQRVICLVTRSTAPPSWIVRPTQSASAHAVAPENHTVARKRRRCRRSPTRASKSRQLARLIRLTTGRRLDSYNTGVQSGGYSSPLRRGESLDLSPEDCDRLDLSEGERVRVNIALAETREGNQLWSERFDTERRSILLVQDEIVGRVSRAIGLKVVDIEARRSRLERPNSTGLMDLVMRGKAVLNLPSSPATSSHRTAPG